MKAKSIVAADGSSTAWTAPFLFLRPEECFHTFILDFHEIFKKAHPEKSSIPGIDMSEVFAGILRTFRAK
jgi:hypothetical protein